MEEQTETIKKDPTLPPGPSSAWPGPLLESHSDAPSGARGQADQACALCPLSCHSSAEGIWAPDHRNLILGAEGTAKEQEGFGKPGRAGNKYDKTGVWQLCSPGWCRVDPGS